jgi:4-hydroxybenzoate polyprenyltransferase
VAYLLAVVCADAGVTTLNDICDVETDRLSTEPARNRRPLVVGEVTPRAAAVQVVLLLATGLVLGWLANPGFAAVLAAIMALGVAYSVPPLRLSGRPATSLTFWPVFGAFCYASVAVMAGRWFTPWAALYYLGVALAAVGENMAKDTRDWDNDAAAGKNTLVVRCGPSAAARLTTWTSVAGTVVLLVLVWGHPDLARWARAAASLLLGWWLWRVLRLAARQRGAYDKDAARELHVGYVSTWLALNSLLLAGLTDLIAGTLR